MRVIDPEKRPPLKISSIDHARLEHDWATWQEDLVGRLPQRDGSLKFGDRRKLKHDFEHYQRGQSKFNTARILAEAIERSAEFPAQVAENGRLVVVFDMGYVVGYDRSKFPTSVVTVVLTPAGDDVVTVYPGAPWPHAGDGGSDPNGSSAPDLAGGPTADGGMASSPAVPGLAAVSGKGTRRAVGFGGEVLPHRALPQMLRDPLVAQKLRAEWRRSPVLPESRAISNQALARHAERILRSVWYPLASLGSTGRATGGLGGQGGSSGSSAAGTPGGEEPAAASEAVVSAAKGAGGKIPSANGHVATQPDCHCSVSSLSVACSHGRKVTAGQTLQIVPERPRTFTRSVEWGKFTASMTTTFGGDDSLDVTLTVADSLTCACGKTSVTEEPQPTSWVGATKRTIAVPPSAEGSHVRWPKNVAPRRFVVQGRGHDEAVEAVIVESFPEYRQSYKIEAEAFADWVKGVNKAWQHWGQRILNLGPVELVPRLEGPKGSLEAEWGWEECQDSRACFTVVANCSLDPILGVSVRIQASMTKLLSSSAGIPPPISDLLAEHIADIIFFGEGCSSARLTGDPKARFYTSGAMETTGEGLFEADGELTLGICARAGSDYVISASLWGEGATRVLGRAAVEWDGEGLYLAPAVILEPLTLRARVELKAIVVYSQSDEREWTPWKDAIRLWPEEETREKILPR